MKHQKERDALLRLWQHLTPWQRRWLRIQGDAGYAVSRLHRVLVRTDLWLFPPVAFLATYRAMSRLAPPHPMAELGILTASVNAATLVLLLIRPPRRRIQGRQNRRS